MATNASDEASLEEQLAVLRADVAASSDADTVAAATAATSSAETKRREALLRGDGDGDPAGLLSELEMERDRVLRSAAKLEESNAELKAAIAAGEDDDAAGGGRELRTAFGENIVVIAKYRARAAALEEEVRKARGVRGSGASVAVEPQWLARPESGAERGGGGAGSGTAAAAAAAPPAAAAAQPASDGAAAAPTATAATTAAEGGGDVWL